MLYSFKDTGFSKLQLQETDHFVCLDKAFEGNDALKQELDNQCKIFTI
jgi:adenine-specific DNA-methyltransferase